MHAYLNFVTRGKLFRHKKRLCSGEYCHASTHVALTKLRFYCVKTCKRRPYINNIHTTYFLFFFIYVRGMASLMLLQFLQLCAPLQCRGPRKLYLYLTFYQTCFIWMHSNFRTARKHGPKIYFCIWPTNVLNTPTLKGRTFSLIQAAVHKTRYYIRAKTLVFTVIYRTEGCLSLHWYGHDNYTCVCC